MQPVQDLTVEDRVSRTQFQYSLEDADAARARTRGRRASSSRLQALPELRDVASDQQNDGLQARLVIDRDTASRLGITPQMIDDTLYDAFGQRQVSTMFTQLNQYHVVLEVAAALPARSPDALTAHLRAVRRPAARCRSAPSRTSRRRTRRSSVNHQGQFPVVTLSFNLAPGASLGDAVERDRRRRKDDLGLPREHPGRASRARRRRSRRRWRTSRC